jgi:hypothetical protein
MFRMAYPGSALMNAFQKSAPTASIPTASARIVNLEMASRHFAALDQVLIFAKNLASHVPSLPLMRTVPTLTVNATKTIFKTRVALEAPGPAKFANVMSDEGGQGYGLCPEESV